MNLTDDQRQRVASWVQQGAKLSEVQTRLADELGIKLTYMEVRFLVDDLKLTLKDAEPPKAPAPVAPKPEPLPENPKPAPGAIGGVSLTVDQLTRPGSLISGKVTFSDGQLADWYLDQMGRLGVVPKQAGYKPAAADVQEFQAALEREVAKMGY